MTEIKDWHKFIRPRWIKEFKSKSDLELIDNLNQRVGKHNEGFVRSFYFTLLHEEIQSREFNSDIIFIDNKGNFRRRVERKVILINNRLEFVEDDKL